MANFGSMAKPFHAGRAAQAGLTAARLSAAGFTAQPDVLEHPQGFLAAVSPNGSVDRESPASGLGRNWQIVAERLNIKKYPTCYYTHRALDGLLDLLARTPLEGRDVERIDVTISRENATVLRNHRPATPLEAKFSIEFAMAGALVARRLGLAELDAAFVRSGPVQQLFERVHVTPAVAYDPDSPGSAPTDQVVITTRGGQRYESAAVRHARGHARLPLSQAELRAKFLDCLAYGGFEGDAAIFFERLEAMEAAPGAL
jgi:2-methylcitrate dehydratase PrpD